jgi:hypothetical protein
MLRDWQVGDRVVLKGNHAGHTGTIIKIKRVKITGGLQKTYHVKLDGTIAGHSIFRVARMNLEAEPDA